MATVSRKSQWLLRVGRRVVGGRTIPCSTLSFGLATATKLVTLKSFKKNYFSTAPYPLYELDIQLVIQNFEILCTE